MSSDSAHVFQIEKIHASAVSDVAIESSYSRRPVDLIAARSGVGEFSRFAGDQCDVLFGLAYAVRDHFVRVLEAIWRTAGAWRVAASG